MNIERKYYFLTIAETQNLTKAAQLLHVSQPSLTQYVNRLEQDMGVQLLKRNHTPLLLTEAGKIYLNFVKESLALEKQFRNRLEQYKEKENNSLSVGIPTQIIPLIFNSFVHNFIQTTPNILFSLQDGTSLTVMDQLLKGDINIAFFHTEKKNDPRFNRHILQTERLLLACNRNSALAAGRAGTRENPLLLTEKDFTGLGSMVFMTYPEKYYIQKVIASYLKKINSPAHTFMKLPNMRAALDYILIPGSNGISVLADFILHNANLDDVTFIKINGFSPKWYLTANHLAHKTLSYTETLFWENVICKASFPDV